MREPSLELEELFDELDDLLGVFPRLTVRGDEIKCWVPDRDNGGTCDVYLSTGAVKRLSKVFGKIAKLMREVKETTDR